MHVYVSTLCLSEGNDIFQVLESYTGAGLKNVELSGRETPKYAGISHKYADSLSPAKLKQYGLGFIVHNFPPSKEPLTMNLSSQDPVILRQSREQIRKSVEFCHDLGIGLLTFHSGLRFDPDTKLRFHQDQALIPYEMAFNTFIESVEEINSYAQQMGIRIAIENDVIDRRNRFPLLCEAEEFEMLWQRLPSSNIGILVDLGHVKVTSHWLGFDKYEFIDKVKDRVFAFHIDENSGYLDEHNKLDETSWCLEVIGRKCFASAAMVLEIHKPTISEIIQQVSLIGETCNRNE